MCRVRDRQGREWMGEGTGTQGEERKGETVRNGDGRGKREMKGRRTIRLLGFPSTIYIVHTHKKNFPKLSLRIE